MNKIKPSLDGGYFPYDGDMLLNWRILTDDEKEEVGSFLKRIDEKTGRSNFKKFKYTELEMMNYLKRNKPEKYEEIQNKIRKHTPEELLDIKKSLFIDLIWLKYDLELGDFENYL